MSVKSLRLRLAVIAIATISIALLLSGVGLSRLFENHVKRRVEAELESYLRQLVSNLTFAADGSASLLRTPTDPRFDTPLSGLYWQIEDSVSGLTLRSRSLWDHVIVLPRNPVSKNDLHHYVLIGPGKRKIVVSERLIYTGDRVSGRLLRLATGMNESVVIDASQAFAKELALSLALLALVLLVAVAAQIYIGLRPLEALRQSVAKVRSGARSTIDVDNPEELMPLVAEVNSLLESQRQSIERAKTQAADLAHGLKTPLTVLSSIAGRLRQSDAHELANEVDDVAGVMLRHVSRETSRARIQASAGKTITRTNLRQTLDGLIRTLDRSPLGAQMQWRVTVPDDVSVAMPVDDLTELLGPLLENAVKWADQEVMIVNEQTDGFQLVIEDDGPGVSPEKLQRLGQRGVRLDENVEGTGLGLAIAIEIADAYGVTLTFGNRQPHGFRVVVEQVMGS